MRLRISRYHSVQSAWKYIDTISGLYTDPKIKQEFIDSVKRVKDVQSKINELVETKDVVKKFKIAENIVSTSVDPRLFMKPYSYDNMVYSAFMDTVCGIARYYQDSNEYAEYPKAVLVPLKRWHYHTSKSAVKDFVYPFLPLAYFAKKRQK